MKQIKRNRWWLCSVVKPRGRQPALVRACACLRMRPVKQRPAHRTDKLAEIVCSEFPEVRRTGLCSLFIKEEELRRAGSIVMEVAAATRVPAGAALAVDRHKFAELITQELKAIKTSN